MIPTFFRRGTVFAVVLAISAAHAWAQLYEFSTLAGRASIGSADGVGSEARFSGPEGVAVDARGNVFVADTKNHTVRRVAADGTVTTIAGQPAIKGSADGVGAEARFNLPAGIAVDSSGNLFVVDQGNHTIRKISPGGVVTTVAGLMGAAGSADGVGDAARFNFPVGIALDAAGNLIVADRGNRTIRRITSGGAVTTVAGLAGVNGNQDGPVSSATFGGPYGIAVDARGNIFVSDYYFFGSSHLPTVINSVRQIAPTGIVTTVLASSRFSASSPQFSVPRGLAVDRDGQLVFADNILNVLWRLPVGGVLTTLASVVDGAPDGGSTDGSGSAARFSHPSGIAMDASGNVYVADTNNNAIRRVTPAGAVSTVAGLADGRGAVDGSGRVARFSSPRSVAADSAGSVLVADAGNHTIRKIARDGSVATFAGLAGSAGFADGDFVSARFSSPAGVAIDAVGNVYVADSGNNAVRKISPAGTVTTFAGGFNRPQALTVADDGTIFVADSGNGLVRKVTPSGVVSTLTTAAGAPLRFLNPTGVAVARNGVIYVVEFDYGMLQKIGLDGSVVAVATTSGLPYPVGGVAVDAAGNLFVTGRFSNDVREITPAGVVTPIGGSFLGTPTDQSRGSADGLGSAALFNGPMGVAITPGGAIVVADTSNHTIRLGVPAQNPARLINSSVLATLKGGDDSVTLGVIVGGTGTQGAKPILARAAGPSLASFGVTGLLADPKLELFSGSTKRGENDDWGGGADERAAFARVGAFPFVAPTSKDAALSLPTLDSGNNSLRVSGNGPAAGIVLAELYDATPDLAVSATTPRLINVSVLRRVDADLTTGFIIGGNGAKTLLLRAVGPSLSRFGVTEWLDDPRLEVFDAKGRRVAFNDNWGGNAGADASTILGSDYQRGAFPLIFGSLDAAVVVTLMPGNYTMHLTAGIGKTTGVVLLEVYEVP
jgi:sugar lactone lactonase YvrE